MMPSKEGHIQGGTAISGTLVLGMSLACRRKPRSQSYALAFPALRAGLIAPDWIDPSSLGPHHRRVWGHAVEYFVLLPLGLIVIQEDVKKAWTETEGDWKAKLQAALEAMMTDEDHVKETLKLSALFFSIGFLTHLMQDLISTNFKRPGYMLPSYVKEILKSLRDRR